MSTLSDIFYESMRPTKALTVLLYVLAATGMYMRSLEPTAGTEALMSLMPMEVWITLLLTMAVARGLSVFYGISNSISRFTFSIGGIILWSLMLVASTLSPNFGMGLLFIAAALIETWFCARSFAERKVKPK